MVFVRLIHPYFVFMLHQSGIKTTKMSIYWQWLRVQPNFSLKTSDYEVVPQDEIHYSRHRCRTFRRIWSYFAVAVLRLFCIACFVL